MALQVAPEFLDLVSDVGNLGASGIRVHALSASGGHAGLHCESTASLIQCVFIADRRGVLEGACFALLFLL